MYIIITILTIIYGTYTIQAPVLNHSAEMRLCHFEVTSLMIQSVYLRVSHVWHAIYLLRLPVILIIELFVQVAPEMAGLDSF